jgi:hypothetical protein
LERRLSGRSLAREDLTGEELIGEDLAREELIGEKLGREELGTGGAHRRILVGRSSS